ncbi:MAG: transpeptidase family protein [Deltaproteobacteria bacterium]|nr:transpeptidase family protein [Deltaproteobacteria bacterium]
MSPRVPGIAAPVPALTRPQAPARNVARRTTPVPAAAETEAKPVVTEAPEARARRWMRVRMALLCVLLLSGAAAVLTRAYKLQIIEGEQHRTTAEHQQLRDVRLAPRRGTIFDRHGAELAVSVDADSVYANPRLMRTEHVDVSLASLQLSRVLGIDAERVQTRLGSDRLFVWLERQVTPEEAAAVDALEIPGVTVTREARRYYPNRELGAHILGFANVDGDGIEGLELSMNERLRGTTSSVPALRDRRGRVVFSEQLLDDHASLGEDVYLTIDKTLQHVAERELALSIRTFEAAAGSIVVMDPQSGEILAMASYPTFDPNSPGDSPPSHRRFRAITDRFEPGSTIKPMTIASALAGGVLRPSEQIDCMNGRWTVVEGERQITDTHANGLLTPAEILAHSSNIGSAQIGMRLGRQGLYRSFRRFGFGQTTGLPLPGEVAGTFRHHSRWYERDFASIGFGQGMSVTAIQLATGMAAIANGGRLMRPTIIRRVEDGRGNLVEETTPEVRRQVMPAHTARLVSDMLTAVTSDEGTGAEAAIDGYLVAGKTGTAQMASTSRAGYDDTHWLSSFVGFVPAESPRAVIAVIIQEPIIDHYGGVVAGPVFRRVGESTMRHLGVPPAGSGDALEALEDRARARARAEREQQRAARRHVGRTEGPVAAVGSADESADAGVAATETREPAEGETRVPGLTGLTARAVMRSLAEAGLTAQLEGSGVVAAQDPPDGSIATRGSIVRVVLGRPSIETEEAEVVEEAPAPAPAPPAPAAPARRRRRP